MRRLATILAMMFVVFAFARPAFATEADSFHAQFEQHCGRGLGASSGLCAIAFCGSGSSCGVRGRARNRGHRHRPDLGHRLWLRAGGHGGRLRSSCWTETR
jgi:hypothetical protein